MIGSMSAIGTKRTIRPHPAFVRYWSKQRTKPPLNCRVAPADYPIFGSLADMPLADMPFRAKMRQCPRLLSERGYQRSDLMSFQSSIVSFRARRAAISIVGLIPHFKPLKLA